MTVDRQTVLGYARSFIPTNWDVEVTGEDGAIVLSLVAPEREQDRLVEVRDALERRMIAARTPVGVSFSFKLRVRADPPDQPRVVRFEERYAPPPPPPPEHTPGMSNAAFAKMMKRKR